MIEMATVEVASNICKLREIELFGVKIGVYRLGEQSSYIHDDNLVNRAK